MSDLEDTNTKAFDRLLRQREIEEKGRLGNYRYFQDCYGNRYGWYTHKQADGKFHAFIYNIRSRKTRCRVFAKRYRAKHWVSQNCTMRITEQRVIIEANKARRAQIEAQKPKLSIEQTTIKKSTELIGHYESLQKKTQAKIKGLVTRSRTYKRRINYHQKKIQNILSLAKVVET